MAENDPANPSRINPNADRNNRGAKDRGAQNRCVRGISTRFDLAEELNFDGIGREGGILGGRPALIKIS